jgi:hypothetical protein
MKEKCVREREKEREGERERGEDGKRLSKQPCVDLITPIKIIFHKGLSGKNLTAVLPWLPTKI